MKGGSTGTCIHFESKLPVSLEMFTVDLSEGVWHNEPPDIIAAFSQTSWSAEAVGLMGRRGVVGSIKYRCEWRGVRSVLCVNFSTGLFGVRRLNCFEESADGDGDVFHICSDLGIGDGAQNQGSRMMSTTVELRENLIGQVVLKPNRFSQTLAATGLKQGMLAAQLEQSSRSCFLRIVNLTRQALLLDEEASDMPQSVWVREPARKIAGLSFHDFGLRSSRWGTKGTVSYRIDAPLDAEEKAFRVEVSWSMHIRCKSWTGPGGVFILESHTSGVHNHVGVFHVLNPRNLPHLDVLEALAMVRQGPKAAPHAGKDITEHTVDKMTSQHELKIPVVQAFVRAKNTSLYISYRIGPEVFRRIFGPQDQLHLSSALSGGTGDTVTVLSAVEAASTNNDATDAETTPVQRALHLQRILTGALNPVVDERLTIAVGKSWMQQARVSPLHIWTREDGDTGAPPELDAQGLCEVMRRFWPMLVEQETASIEMLVPVETLVLKWASQEDLREATLLNALTASVTLLHVFALDAAADEVRSLAAT